MTYAGRLSRCPGSTGQAHTSMGPQPGLNQASTSDRLGWGEPSPVQEAGDRRSLTDRARPGQQSAPRPVGRGGAPRSSSGQPVVSASNRANSVATGCQAPATETAADAGSPGCFSGRDAERGADQAERDGGAAAQRGQTSLTHARPWCPDATDTAPGEMSTGCRRPKAAGTPRAATGTAPRICWSGYSEVIKEPAANL